MKNELEKYFDRLWPICRSITGNGLRESLNILSEVIPLEIIEYPTGTKAFDWEVPREWNIKEAYIETPDGERIADFNVNNLHVLNYSIPVDKTVSFDELKEHIRTLPNQPDAIPYVTSYYSEKWGFCLSQNQLDSLPKEGNYKVKIDSTLEPGSLSVGHCILKGETDEEILISTYVCHPSMANNELSGPLAAAFLYKKLASLSKRKYTYRFVFAPETAGVIAYLSQYGNHMSAKIKAGFVATCCGDAGPFTYKRSKDPTNLADRAAEHLLRSTGLPHSVINFAVGGSDERQYCSPGFNMPVGSLMRTMYQHYPEYHTSLDNKDFISFEALEETVETYYDICRILELNGLYFNKIQHCEPQLGKRGLYPDSLNPDDARTELHNLLHLLSFADGEMDLIEIADRRGTCALNFAKAIAECTEAGILERL